jgi:hypothetical protein
MGCAFSAKDGQEADRKRTGSGQEADRKRMGRSAGKVGVEINVRKDVSERRQQQQRMTWTNSRGPKARHHISLGHQPSAKAYGKVDRRN